MAWGQGQFQHAPREPAESRDQRLGARATRGRVPMGVAPVPSSPACTKVKHAGRGTGQTFPKEDAGGLCLPGEGRAGVGAGMSPRQQDTAPLGHQQGTEALDSQQQQHRGQSPEHRGAPAVQKGLGREGCERATRLRKWL